MMTSLLKFLCLWFVVFGQVSVKAAGLYFSPENCWQHHGHNEKTCQFANNNKHPQGINAAIELAADKNGKGELEGETLFLLPGRYWISSEESLKIQTRHGFIIGKKFSVLMEVDKEVVRCHVVNGSIQTQDEAQVLTGQSVRFDKGSHDLFTIAKDELLENWKDLLALSKRFVDQKKDYVYEWSRQTRILAQVYEEAVERSIAAEKEREHQRQALIQKEKEEQAQRRKLFREKNYLD